MPVRFALSLSLSLSLSLIDSWETPALLHQAPAPSSLTASFQQEVAVEDRSPLRRLRHIQFGMYRGGSPHTAPPQDSRASPGGEEQIVCCAFLIVQNGRLSCSSFLSWVLLESVERERVWGSDSAAKRSKHTKPPLAGQIKSETKSTGIRTFVFSIRLDIRRRFWGCQNGLRGWLIDCDFRCVLDLFSCLISASGAFRSQRLLAEFELVCLWLNFCDCQASGRFVFSSTRRSSIDWNSELSLVRGFFPNYFRLNR